MTRWPPRFVGWASAITALWLASAGGALAQQESAPWVIQIRGAEFRESFEPAVQVSGGTRAGLMTGNPEGRVNPGRLSVFVPRPVPDGVKLCVEIHSVDGQYQAQIERDFGGAQPNTDSSRPYVLEIPTEHAGDLGERKAAEIAVLAGLAASCDQLETLLLTSWDAAIGDTMWVLVNSNRFSAEITKKEDDGITRYRCEDVKSQQRVVYDKICKVDLDLEKSEPVLRLHLWRMRNRLKPVAIPILWPGPPAEPPGN